MNWKRQPQARITFTKAARTQLLAIARYVQHEFGQTVSERVMSNLASATDTLSRFWYLGMVIDQNPRYRKMPIGGRNTFVYRIDAKSKPPRIVVVAVYVAGQNVDYSKMRD